MHCNLPQQLLPSNAHQPAKLMLACGATLQQQTCRSPSLMIAAHLLQGLLLTDSSERMDSLNLLR